MKTLDEIKRMMAAGETVQADESLKELLVSEPDNLQAKMLYGTCRQLLGDEETFRRIHDELAPEMEEDEPKAEPNSHRKKHYILWISLIAGGLVLAGIWTGICLGKDNKRTTSVFSPQETQVIRKARVRGRYVTGCGCGCDNCTYQWFMRDDIQYRLPWHPGKCKARICPCACEHGFCSK